MYGKIIQVEIDQQLDVFGAVAQRRHLQRNHVQVVEQIVTKRTGGDGFAQVTSCGGNHPDVDLHRFAPANAQQGFVFECAQQACLRIQIHIGDVFEKQRAAIGQFERTERHVTVGFRAEQFRVGIFPREAGNADGDERPAGTRARIVQEACDHFLATTGFAGDEHGGFVLCDPNRVLT